MNITEIPVKIITMEMKGKRHHNVMDAVYRFLEMDEKWVLLDPGVVPYSNAPAFEASVLSAVSRLRTNIRVVYFKELGNRLIVYKA